MILKHEVYYNIYYLHMYVLILPIYDAVYTLVIYNKILRNHTQENGHIRTNYRISYLRMLIFSKHFNINYI